MAAIHDANSTNTDNEPAPDPTSEELDTATKDASLVPVINVPAATPKEQEPEPTPKRLLRKAQSATTTPTAPRSTKRTAGSLTDDTLSLNSDSEAEFPDALSLLKTPEVQRQQPRNPATKSQPAGSRGNSKRGRGRKRSRVSLDKARSDVLHVAQFVDTDDDVVQTLQVPGELVMAYSLRKYYPARIMAQANPHRYRVEFLDGSRSTVDRRHIFTQYESGFYTCSLGEFQLVGDEPAETEVSGPTRTPESTSIEREFEDDLQKFDYLVSDLERVKAYLAELHSCPIEKVPELSKTEDRLGIFFGDNKMKKRLLMSRVRKGHLNGIEFDFVGRLLSRWFQTPPRAALGDLAEMLPAETTSGSAKHTRLPATTTKSGNLVVGFNHEVLLPHAIKRLIQLRDKCSLEEAEVSMNTEINPYAWAEQIMAIRRIGQNSRL